LAHAFNATNQHEKAIELLGQLEVLPYEHATGSRNIYTKAYLGSALNALQKNKWSRASSLLNQALNWPERLGVGKPFDPEERLTLMLLALAEKQQNKDAQKYLENIVRYSKKHLDKGGKNGLVGLYAIQFLEGSSAAKAHAEQLQQLNPKQPSIQEAIQFYFEHPTTELSFSLVKKMVDFIQ
jgi:hypothetical protein